VHRDALGSFLRHRREQLQPSDVGMVAGGRRRAPGLRRDEVAQTVERRDRTGTRQR